MHRYLTQLNQQTKTMFLESLKHQRIQSLRCLASNPLFSNFMISKIESNFRNKYLNKMDISEIKKEPNGDLQSTYNDKSEFQIIDHKTKEIAKLKACQTSSCKHQLEVFHEKFIKSQNNVMKVLNTTFKKLKADIDLLKAKKNVERVKNKIHYFNPNIGFNRLIKRSSSMENINEINSTPFNSK